MSHWIHHHAGSAATPDPLTAAPPVCKVLVHDGLGIWLAARRLHQGKFAWPGTRHGSQMELSAEQLHAFILGLPWQRVGPGNAISIL
ncbi:TPA: IS66 family insertion sequence element accessory protein TnpB [Pseudomonas putida]|uniref:IS66 family insertion sequence element accessory protein TnpB n=1 Tax=Pseudomonas putida TaxID=303 RepID=UPI0034E97930